MKSTARVVDPSRNGLAEEGTAKGIATYMLNTIDDYEKVDDEYLREIMYEWLSDMAKILDKYLTLHEQAYKQQYNETNENPLKESTLISYAMFKFLSLNDLFGNFENITDDDPESH